MKTLLESEYVFSKYVGESKVTLALYIDYVKKTYNFMQPFQEGIMPSEHDKEASINKAYLELGLEVIEFVESELYND
jgi:hypothetical protein